MLALVRIHTYTKSKYRGTEEKMMSQEEFDEWIESFVKYRLEILPQREFGVLEANVFKW